MNRLKVILIVGIFISTFSDIFAQESAIEINGFLETRLGFRTQNDPNEKKLSMGEVRLQLETEKDFEHWTLNLVVDFIIDPVMDRYEPDLETGEGSIDPRQINILTSPLDNMDIKIGRQILTWGTGDLVFINDLFAKDWNSLLIGRDDEYLKAPTDALKTSIFFSTLNIDLVYVPKFGADRFIDGKRISFFDRNTFAPRGRDRVLVVDRPDRWFKDDEFSTRLFRSFKAYETAFYYYKGFWKSPAGQDRLSGNARFPELQVIGASLRGPLVSGIGTMEVGFYKSKSSAAENPLSRNSEVRFLAGYEREVATELTASLQYYLEHKLDYKKYLNVLPDGSVKDDENRHLITLRLTQLMMRQNLKLSLFNFYSPSDEDGYLRLNMSYKLSDSKKIEGGGNFFYGNKAHTFFGQFENNSNIYVAMRYEF